VTDRRDIPEKTAPLDLPQNHSGAPVSVRDYRPDIDGLRAIAVLSVLIYHLNKPLLPGGFVGVDIFFVISGYLITSQVYREQIAGTFSLREFYKRRINRIVPALLVVICATLIPGCILLSPGDFVRLAKSSAFALFGASNIFLWREYGNYFGGSPSEAPLLHTWSLGVEEQFYLIWPLLIALLLKLSRRHTLATLSVITVLALALSHIALGIVPSASYYLLPARFFELAIGGVLALYVAGRPSGPTPGAALAGFIAGLALIGCSLSPIIADAPFPGVHALWPCVGAALAIWSGRAEHAAFRIVSNKPMVFIGLISYSLYLWHWPIVAFLRYTNIAIGPGVAGAVFSASILLAWLTWRFIETPLRRTGRALGFSRVFVFRFAIPASALLVFVAAIVRTRGLPARFNPQVAVFESQMNTRPDVLRSGCHVPSARYNTPPDPVRCRLGAPKPEPDGILIGDSHANHFTGMLDVIARAQEISLMDYTMDGCPPIPDYAPDDTSSVAVRCRMRNRAAYAFIAAKRFRRVVLAANWPRQPAAGDRIEAAVRSVIASGAQLTIVLNNEAIDRAASCPIRNLMYGITGGCEAQRRAPPEYFERIRKLYPRVNFIDPNEVICGGGACSSVVEGTLLYRDATHLNDAGSRLIGQALLRLGVTI
jgi:peptidoglycan/LPS O-acetylase OafA/YrhL